TAPAARCRNCLRWECTIINYSISATYYGDQPNEANTHLTTPRRPTCRVSHSSVYRPNLPLPSASPPRYSRMPRLFLVPNNFSVSPSLTLFLSYMSTRDLEQFDKHLELRCPRILEPSLAGLADAF